MQRADSLLQLLIEFFDLRTDVPPENVTQSAVAAWDSLAMVQLISELQAAFSVEFELEELEALRSYEEIKRALKRKGVVLNSGQGLSEKEPV
jgi:acyl carrier protein